MNPSETLSMNRRQWLRAAGVTAGGLLVSSSADTRAAATPEASKAPFRFCLNTSTIRGQDLPIDREIEIAAKAGYDGIEPWLGKLHQYRQNGGSLKELRKRIEDHGLTVESGIGFARWIVDDDGDRAKGFEDAKRDMDAMAQVGAKRIAAPPAGAGNPPVAMQRAGERYRQLLELGVEMGVVPQIEVWGGNPTIGRLSQAIFIAIEAGHPQACFLGDVYHLYKGGTDFESLSLLGPQALQVFHMNDYPANPPRSAIGDRDRVYPGDGVAPIRRILQIFRSVGASPVLSLELFNPKYWQLDALEVAKTGLQKMMRSVAELD